MTLNKQKTRVAANAAAAEAAANAANQVEGSPNKFEDQEFKLQKEEDKVTRECSTWRRGQRGGGGRSYGHARGVGVVWLSLGASFTLLLTASAEPCIWPPCPDLPPCSTLPFFACKPQA